MVASGFYLADVTTNGVGDPGEIPMGAA